MLLIEAKSVWDSPFGHVFKVLFFLVVLFCLFCIVFIVYLLFCFVLLIFFALICVEHLYFLSFDRKTQTKFRGVRDKSCKDEVA